MGNRRGFEFSQRVKNEVFSRQYHKYGNLDEGVELEIDHIVSVRQCREVGIPAWIASSMVNAQLLTRQENREKSDKDADPDFVDYLLSLIVRMF